MTHASLFSGIGGFDLAAEWAGWTNMFNCEIDPFCRRVLKYHFPNSVQYEDIRTTDFAPWRGRIDVLTGGLPCQPFSVAGKRKGTDDDRYLWPEMLRAIREIRPRWVVGENVRGFVNWSEGMVLDTVFADLEALGYEVQPFILPACAVGDWVCATLHSVNGKERLTTPMRVTAIGEAWVQLLVDPKSGYPDKYVIDDIRPVPLTANILMANDWEPVSARNFEWKTRASNNDLIAAVEAEVWNDGMIYISVWVVKHTLKLPAGYVHTLQHALRLAGIKKEIKL